MKRFVALSGICLLFFSASTQDSLKIEAEKRTVKQLDSLAKPVGHRVVIDFTDIKSHMDSLNTQILRLIDMSNIESQKRDSLTQRMIGLMSENIALRESNTEQKKQIEIISKAPTILFYFILMIVATLIGQGISNYYRKKNL